MSTVEVQAAGPLADLEATYRIYKQACERLGIEPEVELNNAGELAAETERADDAETELENVKDELVSAHQIPDCNTMNIDGDTYYKIDESSYCWSGWRYSSAVSLRKDACRVCRKRYG